MVLQSQQTPRGASRSYMFASGRKLNTRWLGLSAIVVVVCVVGYFIMNRGTTPRRAGAGEQEASTLANGHNGSDGQFVPLNGSSAPGGAKSQVDSQGAQNAETSQNPTAGKDNASGEPVLPRGDSPTAVSPDTRGPNTPGGEDDDAFGSPGSTGIPTTTDDKAANKPTTNDPNSAAPGTPAHRAADDPRIAVMIQTGRRLVDEHRYVEARREYNKALKIAQDTPDADELRQLLTELNSVLLFGPAVVPGDEWTMSYTIADGDRLSAIAKDNAIDYHLITRINNMANPDMIRLGQKIKLVRGPFHAEVDKGDFRLDVYLGTGIDDPDRMYVRSFPIGLGELGSTPVGAFRVRPDGKLVNPDWTNPRTGEHFKGGAPDNPIGRFWIGIEGTDAQAKLLSGYGLHGTTDPSSIGRLMSMGCVRLFDRDVEDLYMMLVNTKSQVRIRE